MFFGMGISVAGVGEQDLEYTQTVGEGEVWERGEGRQKRVEHS